MMGALTGRPQRRSCNKSCPFTCRSLSCATCVLVHAMYQNVLDPRSVQNKYNTLLDVQHSQCSGGKLGILL